MTGGVSDWEVVPLGDGFEIDGSVMEAGGDPDGVPGTGRLSRRRNSTDTSKNLAMDSRRASSGVRCPLSQGDHCCGETPIASAHCFEPPRLGYFFIRHSRMFLAMVSRRDCGILPIDVLLPRESVRQHERFKRKEVSPPHPIGSPKPANTEIQRHPQTRGCALFPAGFN